MGKLNLSVSVLFIILGSSLAQDVVFPLKAGTDTTGVRKLVVDSSGKRVKLACVNWYGAHMEDMVVNGLDRQPIESIAGTIADMGFNCVRLVFALDTYYKNPVINATRLSENPRLVGLTAMEVFDETVKALTDAGIIVLLNNHISTAMWCCSPDDGEGLWYTNEYPEDMFFSCLVAMMDRYKDNPLVAGMDLRNEPRIAHGIINLWGGNDTKTDYASAMEKAGNMILEVNPNVLIIIEGILSAGNLMGVLYRPIVLTHPQQLVYSGHIYTFSPIMPDLPYPEFKIAMHAMESFVADAGFDYSAPFWLGETGTGGDPNNENWLKIVRFLREEDHDWAYWALDGYRYPGHDEGYGLLEKDYVTVRHPWKIAQLQEIMPPLKYTAL